jgi:hypothetical protein
MGSPQTVESSRGAGASLLHPIPARGCPEAGIPPQYCECEGEGVLLQPGVPASLARALLKDLGEQLEVVGGCQTLTLEGVGEGRLGANGQGQGVIAFNIQVFQSQARFQVYKRLG